MSELHAFLKYSTNSFLFTEACLNGVHTVCIFFKEDALLQQIYWE